MNPGFLTRDQILDLLREVGADLNRRGIRADLFIVGGAAMALAYNMRRTTRDIDGVYEPKTEVYQAANRIGGRHGLPDGWLNDAVKGLVPGIDPNSRDVLAAPGINVSVPSPEYLLAMKVAAARVDRDADDIRFLADLVGARSADDVLVITERIMGGRRPLLPKAQYLIEEMFADQTDVPALSSRWVRLRSWFTDRRQAARVRAGERAERLASKPVKSPRMGRCGAPTSRGGSCRNRAGSCPNHR